MGTVPPSNNFCKAIQILDGLIEMFENDAAELRHLRSEQSGQRCIILSNGSLLITDGWSGYDLRSSQHLFHQTQNDNLWYLSDMQINFTTNGWQEIL